MGEYNKPNRVGIEGVSYSLAHVPDLVRFGSKPLRDLRGNPALAADLARLLRDFPRRRLMRRIRFTLATSGRKNCAICRSLGLRN